MLENQGPFLPEGLSIKDTQALLDSMHWHHAIDFGGGLVTKSAASLEHMKRATDAFFGAINLKEKTFLDIGAWTGAYSFEAKQRGAKRVVASDHFVWNHPYFKAKEVFLLARKLLGLQVDAAEIDVPFISPSTVGTFDVVLFAGVFYHLLDPVNLTKNVSQCAEHLLILETHQDALDISKPAMIFYPEATLNNDPTNWWGPNPRCLYEMLREFGFAEIFYRNTPGFDKSRGLWHAYRNAASAQYMSANYVGTEWISLSDAEARAQLFQA